MSSHVAISDETPGAAGGQGPRRSASLLESAVRALGSLWYAAVLLVLILVAMACATIYERARGTEQALAMFYQSRWFYALLCLLAVNVSAALVVRIPFGRRQVGFVITHLSILITLAGALITARFGIDGQIGVAEGQTVDTFRLPVNTLSITDTRKKAESSISLTSRDFSGFKVVDSPSAPVLALGDVKIEVTRYYPDSDIQERVANDNPRTRYALLVSLSESGTASPQWVFEDKPASLGDQNIMYRAVTDPDAFAELAAGEKAPSQKDSDGLVRVTVGDTSYDVALADCREKAATIADTGYTVRVLNYYPHASVGADNEIRNVSSNPVNPAVEVELTGPEGTERRMAFALFPNFESMHGEKKAEDVKIVFVAPKQRSAPSTPIEVIRGPEGQLLARFTARRDRVLTRDLTPGTPVESPWPLQRFAVLDQYDHARIDRTVVPVPPRKEARIPAVRLRVSQGNQTTDVSLQKYRSLPTTIGGKLYTITLSDKLVPLGFDLTLDKFTIRTYPGSMQPRSFESRVTIADKTTGEKTSKLISMNNPAQFAGLTLFQSRYHIGGGQRVSYLSVSRDPGMGIVFLGYIGMIGGMIIVLVTRAIEHRQKPAPVSASGAAKGRENGRPVIDAGKSHSTKSHRGRSAGRADRAPAGGRV